MLFRSGRCRELLDTIPDFDEVFASSRKNSTEVQGMLDEFLLGDSDPEENSAETTKYNNEKKADTPSSVDEAFADLLGG